MSKISKYLDKTFFKNHLKFWTIFIILIDIMCIRTLKYIFNYYPIKNVVILNILGNVNS